MEETEGYVNEVRWRRGRRRRDMWIIGMLRRLRRVRWSRVSLSEGLCCCDGKFADLEAFSATLQERVGPILWYTNTLFTFCSLKAVIGNWICRLGRYIKGGYSTGRDCHNWATPSGCTKHTTVFRCLSPFKIGTNISLEKSVWADFSWKYFENK